MTAIVALAIMASAAAVSAAPIGEPDVAGDANRKTLIQFPKLSFNLGSAGDNNWTGSPLPTAAGESPDFEALAVRVAESDGAKNPGTATDAPANAIATAGNASIEAVIVGPRVAPRDRSGAATVPEPASIVMIGLASLALYFFGRRWSRQHRA